MSAAAAGVAAAPVAEIEGRWQRHVAGRYQDQALDGRRGRGRWSTPTSFPVLYLGRPRESVIVEAYRHLIDPIEDNTPVLVPRVLVTAAVRVTEVLDLRTAGGRLSVGLTVPQLTSATTDADAYAACQNVAALAGSVIRLVGAVDRRTARRVDRRTPLPRPGRPHPQPHHHRAPARPQRR